MRAFLIFKNSKSANKNAQAITARAFFGGDAVYVLELIAPGPAMSVMGT